MTFANDYRLRNEDRWDVAQDEEEEEVFFTIRFFLIFNVEDLLGDRCKRMFKTHRIALIAPFEDLKEFHQRLQSAVCDAYSEEDGTHTNCVVAFEYPAIQNKSLNSASKRRARVRKFLFQESNQEELLKRYEEMVIPLSEAKARGEVSETQVCITVNTIKNSEFPLSQFVPEEEARKGIIVREKWNFGFYGGGNKIKQIR